MLNSIILGISVVSFITIAIFIILTINKKGIKAVKDINDNIKDISYAINAYQNKVLDNIARSNNCNNNSSFEKYHVTYINFRNQGRLVEYEDCDVEIHNSYIIITTYCNSIPNNEIFNVSDYKMIGVTRI